MTIDKINTVICGDHLDIVESWPDGCIDLTVTSPPYDDLRDYQGYDFNFRDIARELYRITKDGGVVVWVVGDKTVNGSETGTSFRQALYFKDIGFNLHDTMIYHRQAANPSTTRYWQNFEYTFVLTKGKIKTCNIIKDRKNKYVKMGGDAVRKKEGDVEKGERGGIKFDAFGARENIWYYKVGGGNVSSDRIAHEHPAIFPEQLAIDHIKSWSNEDDLVLDPMVGSGTVCVAAKMLGRRYIGIDISEEYCEIARMRLKAVDTGVPVAEQRQGQKGLFE